MNAADWLLISSKGSKYAHAPSWTPWGHSKPPQPACGVAITVDPYQMDNDFAEGKPPCPKCVARLRWHLQWLQEWTASYERLDWTTEEAT